MDDEGVVQAVYCRMYRMPLQVCLWNCGKQALEPPTKRIRMRRSSVFYPWFYLIEIYDRLPGTMSTVSKHDKIDETF